MITYSKNFWGLHHLLRLYGSAIPRTLAFAGLSSGLAALFVYIPYRGYFKSLLLHPYPFQIFAFVVGFALVFRTNQGYQRYWEGCTQLQSFTVELANVCCTALSFEAATLGSAHLSTPLSDALPSPHSLQTAPAVAVHPALPEPEALGWTPHAPQPQQTEGRDLPTASMHGTQTADQPESAHSLPGDVSPSHRHQQGRPSPSCRQHALGGGGPPPEAGGRLQRQQHHSTDPPPDACLQQAISYKHQLLHSVSLFHGLALQHLRSDWRLDNLSRHDPAQPPPPLDGRGLGNIDPGYQIALVDMLTVRGATRQWGRYYRAMKIPVLGGVTEQERRLLGQELEADSKVMTETVFSGLDQTEGVPGQVASLWSSVFGGWDQQTGRMVPGASERVYTAYLWLELLLASRVLEGEPARWKVPGPVASTLWARLGAALNSFEQCRKLTSTPFPFPWAQTIVLLLLIFSLTLPLLMAAYVSGVWMAVVFTFLPVLTYWALNEVARDLEDPFLYDPNELPLPRQQYDFNKRVLASAEAAFAVAGRGLQAAGAPDTTTRMMSRSLER